MKAFHKTYLMEGNGTYSYETKMRWFDEIRAIVNTVGLENPDFDNLNHYDDGIEYLHLLALEEEKSGIMKFDFEGINSQRMLVNSVYAELENNGWIPNRMMGLEVGGIDVKAEKNGKIVFIQCIYDVGKIGVGKAKKKLLLARSEESDQVVLLSLHGFTHQAERLCKEAGSFAVTPDQIPFVDNWMGI